MTVYWWIVTAAILASFALCIVMGVIICAALGRCSLSG